MSFVFQKERKKLFKIFEKFSFIVQKKGEEIFEKFP